MWDISYLFLVCVFFIGVFQISETYAKDCERKEKKPCTSHSECTPGVTACFQLKNDNEKKCNPCLCRDPAQCIPDSSNKKLMCTCDAGSTGDHCECPLYTPPAECPADWTKHGMNCYFFSVVDDNTIKKNWNDAKTYCEDAGGHLSKIDDQVENSYIGNTVPDRYSYYWIGGKCSDIASGGRCQWYDGEDIDVNTWTFTQTDGCMEYNAYDKTINRYQCTNKQYFICEKNL